MHKYNEENGGIPRIPKTFADTDYNSDQDVLYYPIPLKGKENKLKMQSIYSYFADCTEAKLNEQDLIPPLEISYQTPGLDAKDLIPELEIEYKTQGNDMPIDFKKQILELITSTISELLKKMKLEDSYLSNFYGAQKSTESNGVTLQQHDFESDLEIWHETPGYNAERFIQFETGEQSEQDNNSSYESYDNEQEIISSSYLTDNTEFWIKFEEQYT